MIERVDAEWEAYWDCPKCNCQCSGSDYDVDFSDAVLAITCAETEEGREGELIICGYTYEVRTN